MARQVGWSSRMQNRNVTTAYRAILKTLKIVWALPNTLLGLLLGTLLMSGGGRVAIIRGAVEFSAGKWLQLFAWLPNGPIAAITFGHVILGATEADLIGARDHEHVHIRQYERWGPLFLPSYVLCSLYLFWRGRDPYRDNPFEIEAYREAG